MSTRPGLVSRPSSIAGANKTVVLISGGNAGIGYEIVKSLATSQPNYQILMGCRDTSKGEAAASAMGAPVNVNPIQLDITDDKSVEYCYKTIDQMFGKLDILINNAGTAGNDLLRESGTQPTLRQRWEHITNINIVSTGVLTDKMTPLLQQSKLPKIIFISSRLGSIGSMLENGIEAPVPEYISSKAAVNALTVFYSKMYPKFKVNSVCPGLRKTGLSDVEESEETDPALGAVNAVRLATEGLDGATGTYSSSEGAIPW